MKLTWFGGTTLRIYIGGHILVTDPLGALGDIELAELVSGADRTFALDDDLPDVDPTGWQPRRPVALVDDTGAPSDVLVHRAGDAVLIDAVGEPPLLLVTGQVPKPGRWGRDAVVIVAGNAVQIPAVAAEVLVTFGPRLIALAAPEATVDGVLDAIASRIDGTGLAALEPGLALEV